MKLITPRKNVSIVLILLFLSLIGKSNNDFRSGYIIENTNDTIHGLINWQKNSVNSKVCVFKLDQNAEVKRFTPSNILEYSIDNHKKYVTRVIGQTEKKDTVFLEYLVHGVVSLYYLSEKGSGTFYLEKEGQLYELNNDVTTITDQEGKVYSKRSNRYKGMLTYVMDSPEMQGDIYNSSFSQKSLIATTVDYHNLVCDDYECVDYAKTIKKELYLELITGVANSYIVPIDKEGSAFSISPVFGAMLEYKTGLLKDRWSFVSGIKYFSIDYESEFTEAVNETLTFTITRTYKAKYNVLNVPIIMKYAINPSYNHLYSLFGLNTHIALYSEENIRRSGRSGVVSATSPIDFHAFHLGVIGGVGYSFLLENGGSVNASLSYDMLTSLPKTNYQLDRTLVHTIQFNIAYSFKLK